MKTCTTYQLHDPTTSSGSCISITTTYYASEEEIESIHKYCKDVIGAGLVQEYTNSLTSQFDNITNLKSCKTCRYYSYAFEGHPCTNCQRNYKLVDEIREQKNDLWKDGTFNG